MAQKNWKKD